MASATNSSTADGNRRPGWRRWLPRGMRMRIAVSTSALFLVLILAQSFALVTLFEEMEEDFIESTLDQQLRYSIEHSRQLGTLIQPRTPNMRLYRFTPGAPPPTDLPPALAGLPAGHHEIGSSGRELHIAVREADGQRYLLVYDESEHLARESTVMTVTILGGLILTILAFILVHATAARLTHGLEKLAERVEREDDDTPFSRIGLEDELLVVARALERAQARHAALLEREREFNANLSHELRTPLAGIRSDAEMLLADPALPDKLHRRAERIIATTDRTTALAHGLLLLAREARARTLESVNLAAAVDEACGALNATEPRTSPLTIDIDPEVHVDADAILLRLMLRNLIENALRHGEGRSIEIALDGGSLNVRDRGPGFGDDDPMRCFERFRRGDREPGHGLGLALVRHICAAHGWVARAANRPGGGACLSIDFGAGLKSTRPN